jgi:hypothetical protein
MGDDGGVCDVYDCTMNRPIGVRKERFTPALMIGLLVSIGVVLGSCGSGATSTRSPANATPALDPSTIPKVTGQWTGTIESPAFETRSISAQFVQSLDCVDGAWKTGASEWNGAISGFAREGSFSGFISIEGSLDGSGLCGAINQVSGATTDTAIEWTMVNDGKCTGGMAQTVTFKLHR